MSRRRGWNEGGIRKKGTVWYIRVSHNGQRHEIATKAKTRSEAIDMLTTRLGQLSAGLYDFDAEKTRIAELYEDIQRDYVINGRQVKDLAKRWNHLEPVFGRDLARSITTSRLSSYVDARLKEGTARATVQKELACLGRMFRLGFQASKVSKVPYFPTITVENARQGFLEYNAFEAVRDALPVHLRPLIAVAYWTGWRRSELLRLEWRQLNLVTGEARLDPGTTKNKAGRVIFLPAEALEALRSWRQSTLTLERAQQRLIPWVFHQNGKPVRKFDRAWKAACKIANVPGQLFHDLRRSSVRNYIRSGVPERVAMAISGHKTRSIFDRYNIVSAGDLQAAASKVTAVRIGEELGQIVELPAQRATGDGRYVVNFIESTALSL